jgi:hypothetical protein
VSLALVGSAGIPAHAADLAVRTHYQALVLYYNPHVWKDGRLQTVREAYQARDVDLLCSQFIQWLKRASGGQVNFSVVARFELDEFPPDLDPEVTFTAENYDRFRNEGYDIFNSAKADYPTIINDPRFRIVPRVEADEIDAVWIFAPDGTGFWETAMAGRDAYWINGEPYPEINCSKRFVLYGFGMAAHQGVGFMCENTAHMTENILGGRIMHAWPGCHFAVGWNTLNLANPNRRPLLRRLNDWEFFTSSDAVHWDAKLVLPGRSQAGLSHFPPTACVNYGWSPVHLEFHSAGEAENFLTFGGPWRFGNGACSVEPSASPGSKVILRGSHDLRDESGEYRVPVIITDADVSTSVRVGPGARAGLLVRCSLFSAGENAVRGYYIGLDPGRGRIQIARLDNAFSLLAEQSVELEPDTPFPLYVTLRGPEIRIARGPAETPVLVYTNANHYIDGAVGFTTYGGAAAFTHLQVTPVIINHAEAWRTYPQLSSAARILTPLEWRGDGQPYEDNDYFFAWWYEHLPKNPGTHLVHHPTTGEPLGRVLNSWWPYIFDINRFDTPFLPDGNILTAPADTSPPAAPANVRGTPESSTAARIEWVEPADDVGVTRYEVYRDGQFLRETPLQYFIDESLQPRRAYVYTIKARDGSANVSAASAPVSITTLGTHPSLINGNFELGLTLPVRWNSETFLNTAVLSWEPVGTGRDGSRCVSIHAETDRNDARWTQSISGLVPEGRYLLEGWIKGENITLDPGASVGANLCAVGTWTHSTPLLIGTFDWTRVQCYVTADASGTLAVGCRLGYWSSLAGGKAWFDDLSLTHAPPGHRPMALWGLDLYGLNDLPEGLENVAAIAAGESHLLGLKPDGSVLAWGSNWSGEAAVPAGLSGAIGVAAGSAFSLAVSASGRVFAWGSNLYGQCDPPTSLHNALAVAAGSRFSLALRADGTVTAWGGNDWGETDVPAGLNRVVAIAAGHEFALALRDDGTLVSWGSFQNYDEEVYPAFVPDGLDQVIAIACGTYHALALRADGTVTAWGENPRGQTNVPPGLDRVIAIAAGADHSLALRADGTVTAWGASSHGELDLPNDVQNAFAVEAGTHFSLALLGLAPPGYTVPPAECGFAEGQFCLTFPSLHGRSYFLESKTALDDRSWRLVQGLAATQPTSTLVDPNPAACAGFYIIATAPWRRTP